ncbi:hypothetical protein [Corallococcus coralloides]|nr:hypothetical protein [Corallococcus coralloides]
MDHEKFKNVANGIQSLVFAVGAVVTAGWAIFTFTALGSQNKAAAEQLELEQRIRQEPMLQIELSMQQSPALVEDQLLRISAVLRNEGKRTLAIGLMDGPLTMVRVDVTGGHMKVLSSPLNMQNIKIESNGQLTSIEQRILRPGQSRTIPFAVRVSEPGDYLIQFSGAYAGVELRAGDVVDTKDVTIEGLAQIFVHVAAKSAR